MYYTNINSNVSCLNFKYFDYLIKTTTEAKTSINLVVIYLFYSTK